VLGIGWKDGIGTIVDRRLVGKTTEPDMGEFAGQGTEVFEFIADVEDNDGSAHFRAELKEPFNAITFKPPEVGQRVKVKLHPKDQKAKFDRSDDGTYQHVPGVPDWRRHGDPLKEADKAAVAADHTDEAQARWEARLNQAPGSSPADAAPAEAAPQPAAEVELGAAGMSAQNEDRVKPTGAHLSMAEIVELRKQVDRGEMTEAEFEARRSGGVSPGS
jgi:hypothetical protein